MTVSALKAIGLGIGLFVVVYVPAFVTTTLVRPRIDIAIPLIIAITSLVALILMFLSAQGPPGIAEFGFRIPHSRYLAVATVFGLALGIAVTFKRQDGFAGAVHRFNLVFESARGTD